MTSFYSYGPILWESIIKERLDNIYNVHEITIFLLN